MSAFAMTEDQRRRFHDDGFFIAERLFDAEEIDLLGKIARADHRFDQEAVSRRDAQGSTIRLRVENELHDDVYGAIVRCRRIVDSMERLLDGEVYHYHHKMILKEPFTGGAWEWHQDYGYWYNNGCLYPLMASCMIAVDRATEENGCLQVLRGSHHLGRIEHGKVGDQTGADPERVAAALERLETVHCALEPGSAIFFHCNLLHSSAQNKSANPRWAFIACYNAARNDPYKESRHPRYSRMEKLPDEAVREVGRRQLYGDGVTGRIAPRMRGPTMTPDDVSEFLREAFPQLARKERHNPDGWSFFLQHEASERRIITVTQSSATAPMRLLLAISRHLGIGGDYAPFDGNKDELRNLVNEEIRLHDEHFGGGEIGLKET